MYTTATAYRPRRIPSPFQPVKQMPKRAFNAPVKNHPVHPVQEEIAKCVGSHDLVAIVEEDTQTLDTMRGVEGLVAFLATLKKDGRVIAQGRGSSILGSNNRFVSRAVGYAFNASIADATYRATRGLDTFRGPSKTEVEEVYQEMDRQDSEPASEKQRNYLFALINDRIPDEDEREQRLSQLGELTKQEAGSMIEEFLR